ncbi:MAG: hypothetical protein H6618_05155 [Deltaproteobacteria bacterium]|nr:hypothetical protein [Deltaproteobacteria bacterium]
MPDIKDNNKSIDEESIQKRFFHLLQVVKKEKNWTNKDLARHLNVSVSLVEKWNSNTVSTFVRNYFKKIHMLAHISGHSTASLMAMLEGTDYRSTSGSDVAGNLSSVPPSYQQLIRKLLILDQDGMKMAMKYITFFLQLDKNERDIVLQFVELIQKEPCDC